MSLGEFQLISRYLQSVGSRNKSRPENSKERANPYLEIGIGDDAAVITGIGNHRLVVSTDTLIESVHFPEDANPELLARRALRVNLSDMAAMGAEPRWFTLALTMPEVDESWLQGFSQGLHTDALSFGCQLIGGDTTKGPLNIGIQIMGTIPENRAVLTRSGALPGDLLVVTGTLGDAGAALAFNLNGFNLNDSDLNGLDLERKQLSGSQFLLNRYWLPSPRIDFALESSRYINAACDISDGLLADAGHLCEQSKLSAVIDLDRIPVSSDLLDVDASARLSALIAGDDYELCMAVSPEHLVALEKIARAQGTSVTVVGQFEDSSKSVGSPISVRDNKGNELQIETTGYKHF